MFCDVLAEMACLYEIEYACRDSRYEVGDSFLPECMVPAHCCGVPTASP